MNAPAGFEPFGFIDTGGIEERRLQFTHRRKVPGGWDYWRDDQPAHYTREVWLSDTARITTIEQLEG